MKTYIYYAIWKCRLCGGTDETAFSQQEVWKAMHDAGLESGLNIRRDVLDAAELSLITTHQCTPDQMGLADFVGFRREEQKH